MLGVHTINDLEGLGAMVSDKKFDERISKVRTDKLATISYTSGSADAPKGAELTRHIHQIAIHTFSSHNSRLLFHVNPHNSRPPQKIISIT